MESKYLLEGEKLIKESSNETVALTNYRIRYYESKSGHANLITIMLEKLCAIEVEYKSNLYALVIGILAVVGATIAPGIFKLISLAVGALLIFLYFKTRKHVISMISDSGESIDVETEGMSRESVLDFVHDVEKAKLNRVNSL